MVPFQDIGPSSNSSFTIEQFDLLKSFMECAVVSILIPNLAVLLSVMISNDLYKSLTHLHPLLPAQIINFLQVICFAEDVIIKLFLFFTTVFIPSSKHNVIFFSISFTIFFVKACILRGYICI